MDPPLPQPQRLSAGAWRRCCSLLDLEGYRRVYETLRTQDRMSEATADAACNYLFHFVREFQGTGDGRADLQCLSGTREDGERARRIWEGMVTAGGWNPRHTIRVRRRLAAALGHVVESVAQIVDPRRRPGPGGGVTYTVDRSHCRRFTLAECLPRRVRALGAMHPDHALLSRLVDEMTVHLRSLSRAHLQHIAAFLDVLVFGTGVEGVGSVLSLNSGDTVEDRWRELQRLQARDWLRRLEVTHQHKKKSDGGAGGITFDHFKRLVRYVSVLHGRVLHNTTTTGTTTIPVPLAAGRVLCTQGLPELSTGASTSMALVTTSSGDEPHPHRGPGEVDERRRLREELQRLRGLLCRERDEVAEANRLFAFDAAEVRAILDAAGTPLERLVVCLFLTTGLRIGGLARLRVPPAPSTYRCGAEVPPELSTVEKGNRVRRVRLTDTCRILVARWYAHGRPTAPATSTPSFLFPSARDPTRSMSPRRLWAVCRVVFTRAGLHGPHVHPHTFRHTVIQMLYMKGMSFEAIAKWIGHANPSVTSGVYGRLSQRDVHSLMTGVPFIDNNHQTSSDVKAEWTRLARLVHRPYVFDEVEWAGLPGASATATATTTNTVVPPPPRKQQALLDYADAALAADGVRETVRRMVQEELNRNHQP